YAGMAMTSLGTETNTMKNVSVAMYYLVAPPTGQSTVVVTFRGDVPSALGGSASFTGVDQTTPTSGFTATVGHDQPPPASIMVPSRSTDIVLDTVVIDSNPSNITVSTGQTQRWMMKQGIWGAGSTRPGAASDTMTWTQTGMPDDWAIAATSIRGG